MKTCFIGSQIILKESAENMIEVRKDSSINFQWILSLVPLFGNESEDTLVKTAKTKGYY